MSSLIVSGDTSGTITISAPAVAGSNTLTLPASTGTVGLTSDIIGVGQTWQVVTGSRALSTTYTNSTGKPIMVVINCGGSNVTVSALVNGTSILTGYGSASANASLSWIVPNGATYSVTGGTLQIWTELR